MHASVLLCFFLGGGFVFVICIVVLFNAVLYCNVYFIVYYDVNTVYYCKA